MTICADGCHGSQLAQVWRPSSLARHDWTVLGRLDPGTGGCGGWTEDGDEKQLKYTGYHWILLVDYPVTFNDLIIDDRLLILTGSLWHSWCTFMPHWPPPGSRGGWWFLLSDQQSETSNLTWKNVKTITKEGAFAITPVDTSCYCFLHFINKILNRRIGNPRTVPHP